MVCHISERDEASFVIFGVLPKDAEWGFREEGLVNVSKMGLVIGEASIK